MAHDQPRCQVLLATHNGAAYVEEQLDSIAAQERVQISILWLDDKSTDGTRSIVQRHAIASQIQEVADSGRLGVPGAFLHLLERAPLGLDMYAFCDQDDVWMPSKLASAWECMLRSGLDNPTLVISPAVVIGSESHGTELKVQDRIPGLKNALVETIAPGCVMVWNAALQRNLKLPRTRLCRMHDSWLYVSAEILGGTIVVPEISVAYRLHSGNAVGMHRSWHARWRRSRRRDQGTLATWNEQAQEVLRLYRRSLHGRDLQTVTTLASGSRLSRFLAFFTFKVRRFKIVDQFVLGLSQLGR